MSFSTCIIRINFTNGESGYFVRWEDDGFRWTKSDELATEVSYHAFFGIQEKLQEYDEVESVYYEMI